MGDYLSFKKMITPILIRVAFWLGVIGSVGAGVLIIVDEINAEQRRPTAFPRVNEPSSVIPPGGEADAQAHRLTQIKNERRRIAWNRQYSKKGYDLFILCQGILLIGLGPIGVRLVCEMLIVMFSFNDTLTEIRNTLEDRSA